jgi:RNA polymerase II-associated factor 1
LSNRMAPTVGSKSGGRSPVRNRRPGGSIERSGLICRVKYTNSLPDIPFDPKSIKYPFARERFIKYKPTTLEKLCKVELHTDFDLGVNIDLIDPETYIRPPNASLDPDDNALLQEDDAKKGDTKRSSIHNKEVTFFRPSEYISQDFKQYGTGKDKTESKIGAGVKDRFKDDEIYKDRDAQIKAIEKTFKDAQTPIVEHYSKKGVTAVETLPLLPDFEMWKHPCAQVIFDTDPAPKGIKKSDQHAIMSQAMIRGMVDEDNDQFVAYFLPTEDTVDKRQKDRRMGINYDEEEVYDYRLTKEYNWNVKNKASKGYEENFFFCFRPNEGVFYNELETRVRLSKRVKGRDQKTQHSNTILAVKHRKMDENEIQAQEMRKQALEHTQDDQSDEDDDDDSSDESSTGGGESDGEKGGEKPAKMSDDSDSDKEDGEKKKSDDSDSDSDDGDKEKAKIFGDSDSDSSNSD